MRADRQVWQGKAPTSRLISSNGGIALARDLSLADYLIKVFLPGSPALLDCTQLARSHWRHATSRENAEKDIQDIWDAHRDNSP
jgi:hypothetical protein